MMVLATIAPLGALAREVAGSSADVRVLAGTGVDPHDYELNVSGRRAIEDARLIFRDGLGIDTFLDRAIASGNPRVVTVTEGLKLRQPPGESDPDPHVWQDPENDRAMVLGMAAAMGKADPANAGRYRQNAEAYSTRLAAVDEQIRAMINTIPPGNRRVVTNHDALGYFIDRYGLTFVGTVIPGTASETEPSARDIAQLEDVIRAEGVKAIFAESSVDPKVARQVAADTGVRIVDNLYGDSLGPPGSGAETVDGMLLTNARTIVEALR